MKQSLTKLNPSQIIAYQLEEDSVNHIANYIEEQCCDHLQDLGRLAIVFPGKRPHLFLKRELARRIQKSFFSPHFFTIDSFIDCLLLKRENFSSLTDMDACYFLYSLVQKKARMHLPHTDRFAQFLPWAHELLAFIDHCDLDGISSDQLHQVEESAQIGYDIPQSLNTILASIAGIREAFHTVMIDRHLYSRGMRYHRTAQAMNDIYCPEFDTILFCNFFFLHHTESTILKVFKERGQGIFFFQGGGDEWECLRDTARALEVTISPSATQDLHTPAITLHAGTDTHSQVSTIHSIIHAEERMSETVIVLPKTDALLPLLSEIPLSRHDFNVSMGYPLKRSAVYSLCELIFRAQTNKRERAYYGRDYLHVIRHPLLKNLTLYRDPAYTRIVVHKIEEILLGIEPSSLGGSLYLNLNDILACETLFTSLEAVCDEMGYERMPHEELQSLLSRLHEYGCTMWEDIKTFHEFMQKMNLFLEMLINKSPLEKYPLNVSIVQRIFHLLDELQHAAYKDEAFSLEDIFQIFLNELGRMKISFTGSPLKGLQILGTLETRSLKFKNVLIMDMNEGVMPDVRRYMPLIPREVMSLVGLKLLHAEEEIQRYYFTQLIRGAENVHLIYNGAEERERSRFIEELLWDEEKKVGRTCPFPYIQGQYQLEVTRAETCIEKTPEIITFLEHDFIFSASSINTYCDCPLRFYYQYILRLREKEDFLEDPEASYIGNFIHRVCEEAYAPQVLKKSVQIDKKFSDYFFRIFKKRFDELFQNKMKADAFLLKKLMEYRLKQFLQVEKERTERTDGGAFKKILGLEKPYEDYLVCGSRRVRFKAFVDRIDECADGTILVLDYKTGGPVPFPTQIHKQTEGICSNRQGIKKHIHSFQLPLYLHFVEKDLKPEKMDAALYYVRTSTLDYFSKKIGEEYPFVHSMPPIMHSLEYLIDEILDPHAPFVPDHEGATQCRTCPFSALC